MRNDAATRIKRKIKFMREQRELMLNKNQILDQLRFKSCIRIIQRWFRGIMKTIKAKRSTVNPAVE